MKTVQAHAVVHATAKVPSRKYRFIKRKLVTGRDSEVEQALNKFAGFGYRVVAQTVSKDEKGQRWIYFTLARSLTDKEAEALAQEALKVAMAVALAHGEEPMKRMDSGAEGSPQAPASEPSPA